MTVSLLQGVLLAEVPLHYLFILQESLYCKSTSYLDRLSISIFCIKILSRNTLTKLPACQMISTIAFVLCTAALCGEVIVLCPYCKVSSHQRLSVHSPGSLYCVLQLFVERFIVRTVSLLQSVLPSEVPRQ